MALQQAVGIAVGMSTTLPATHDSSGFAALTYTSGAFLSSVPDLDGEYDIANFDNLTTGQEEKFSDIFRAGDGNLQFGFDPTDSGQGLLEGAKGDKVAFKFTLKSGIVYYRIAIVRSYRPTGFEAGNVVMADVSLAFEKTTVKVAAP